MRHEFSEAGRSLLRRPAFALLVVIPLGLAIGSASTVFSAVYGILLKPLPYPEPERLVQVWERRPQLMEAAEEIAAFSTDHFREWREANTVFREMAMYGDRPVAYRGLSASPTEARPLAAHQVSPSVFEVLGVGPAHGRAFLEEESVPGRDAVVLLTDAFWQREFGGDHGIVGELLLFDDRSFEVIGIMPSGFAFPNAEAELFVPYPVEPAATLSPGQVRLELVRVIARLGDGVTVEQAEAEAGALIARLSEASPIQQMLNEGVTVHLTSFQDRASRRVRGPLQALFGVTLLVLLIACGNVANLLFTRAAGQGRELAVRTALGADRRRLLLRLFAESALLAVGAGVLGALISVWGAGFVRSLTVLGLPELAAAETSLPVLGFVAAAALGAAVLAGTLPAWRAASRDPSAALSGSARGDDASLGAARGFGGGGLFASLQLALALPLLIGAGLLTRSFLALAAEPPGYEPRDTVVLDLQFPESRYGSAAAGIAALERIEEELGSLPGVLHVGVVDTLPLSGERAVIGFRRISDQQVTDPNQVPRALLRRVSSGYFAAMGIPVLEGRVFSGGDRSDAGRLAVVNRSLVDRYLEDAPIGLELPGLGRIVGVVGDVHEEGAENPTEPILYRLYADSSQLPTDAFRSRMSVVLRHAPGAGIAAAAIGRVEGVDAAIGVLNPRTLKDPIRESVARPRLYALLMGGFALAAAFLAAWGVFSVVSFHTSSRLSSHGVRLALGATPTDIRRLVLKEGLRIAAFGLVPGLLLTWLLQRLLTSELTPLLFRITPLDPTVYAAVPLILLAAVFGASLQPARLAARLDVVTALRGDAPGLGRQFS